ncbi:CRISPR-associated protein, Csm2 family [Caldanaerobius fijiensis DSM 17918]|uniref:CRISPR system Cms protein Csm2 n=1 Tax=Caldanaerobius fijiensis DSM 17918 TaxID=1121256 RepID=A0A1M4SM34_9THEO|nr:type III-A CRISPR-associated protein Csm2 [Caldanaerobius fijiensis]SHE33271.1 CRISPR-associated protein, Csm2 family [Caldanaerobius fijiensis DSM 17918]
MPNDGMGIKNNTNKNLNDIMKKINDAIDAEKDPKGDAFLFCAQETGRLLAEKKVSISQIRKVYSEARRIKYNEDGIYRLKILEALLAYMAGRFKELKEFKDILTKAIGVAEKNEKNFKRFIEFFQAVIAYHRANGGKE